MPIDPINVSTALSPTPRPGTPPPSDPPTSSATSMQTDSVHKTAAADRTKLYTAESIHAAINGAAHTATTTASAIAVGASGAIERLGPTIGDLGTKGAEIAGGAVRAAAPIAGTALGAAGFVLATAAPAGETPDQLAHARAIDAQGRQGSTTTTPAAAPRGIEHTGNGAPPAATIGSTGTPIEHVGNSTTTTPAHSVDRPAMSGKPVGPAVTAADHATLKVDAHDVQQKYLPGWTVGQASVTRTDSIPGRAAFETKNGPKETYVKALATNHADELKAAGLSETEIENMKKGDVPDGYNVHHIIGLFQGGTNNPENLVLTRDQPEHRKITGQQNSAMAGLNYGDTRTVDVLYPPKGTVIYKGTP